MTEKLKNPELNKDIINKRLVGLSSNTIKVSIGTELISLFPLIVEDIDRFFRHLTFIFKFGIIDKSKIDNELKDIIRNSTNKRHISNASLLTGLKFANQLKLDLKSTNYFIMEDK